MHVSATDIDKLLDVHAQCVQFTNKCDRYIHNNRYSFFITIICKMICFLNLIIVRNEVNDNFSLNTRHI
jgi:hypothetical protein